MFALELEIKAPSVSTRTREQRSASAHTSVVANLRAIRAYGRAFKGAGALKDLLQDKSLRASLRTSLTLN